MKIKNLMDQLNKEHEENSPQAGNGVETEQDENVVYIENNRIEMGGDSTQSKALMTTTTQWADRTMGNILMDLGKITADDVERIIDHQRGKGLYFGEAAIDLDLISKKDVLQVLSSQFGYSYNPDEEPLSQELILASSPFIEQAEEFRTIRGQLVSNWLSTEKKTLAVVSPGDQEGKSYVAANLALAFSQLGRSTLLVDANLRKPRQHELFDFSGRLGLSMLLAGRVKLDELSALPNQINSMTNLSVLGAGAIPPNPAELLSRGVFPRILMELRKYFDVIIIDTPSAEFQGDIIPIVSAAQNALLVAHGGNSRLDSAMKLKAMLKKADVELVGAVLNQF